MTERFQLTPDLNMCRILNGMWQVSGAHGEIDPEAAVHAMFSYQDAGFTTWDLADHYGPAEDFVGEFRRRGTRERGDAEVGGVQFFTKWVPQPGRMRRSVVEQAVKRSLRRMDIESIDLLQFHWWDYEDAGYLDALSFLADLKQQGLIRHLALTNFDTEHLRLIVERDIPIVSNQVQYSLIDRRPEVATSEYCLAHNIHLLPYGSLAGGLLSERFLGALEPAPGQLNTASLHKYKQMIDIWGGWGLFQELLQTLNNLATAKNLSIANLAVRYVLERPAVAGVIIGARLGLTEHIKENVRAFDLTLDREDMEGIETVLRQGRDLFQFIGDCGDEYRR